MGGGLNLYLNKYFLTYIIYIMFSFRLDKIGDDQQMKSVFTAFNDNFNCKSFVICYEEKSKVGIECKPHYHGIGSYPTTIKMESQRDKMKKYFGKVGFDHALSHVSIVKDKAEYMTGLLYTCKQQQVFMTSFTDENIQELLKQSRDFQDKIKSKRNCWSDHAEVLQEQFIEKKITKRLDMMYYIYDYIIDFNKNKPTDPELLKVFVECKRPCDNTIKNFIINCEMLTLDRQSCLNRWEMDNYSFLSNDYDALVAYQEKEQQLIISRQQRRNRKADPLEYVDSDNDL